MRALFALRLLPRLGRGLIWFGQALKRGDPYAVSGLISVLVLLALFLLYKFAQRPLGGSTTEFADSDRFHDPSNPYSADSDSH